MSPDRLVVRVSGIPIEITTDGCSPVVVAAVEDYYRHVRQHIPVTPIDQVALAPGDDAARALAALHEEFVDIVVQRHEREGLLNWGACAVLDDNGSALVVVGDGSDDANAALLMLRESFAVADPHLWFSDSSGALVFIDDLFALELGQAPPTASATLSHTVRVIGALVLSGEDLSTSVDIRDRADDVAALVSHVCGTGVVGPQSRPLKVIATLIEVGAGIRRVFGSELDNVRQTAAEMLARRPSMTVPPADSRASVSPLSSAEGGCFRGPVHEFLDLYERIVIIRREDVRFASRKLDAVSSALWRDADGRGRDSLVAGVAALGYSGVAGALDRLESEGLVTSESSLGVAHSTIWIAKPDRTFVLNALSETSSPIVLEGSAHVIWELLICEPGITLNELINRCAQVFSTDPGHVQGDVRELVETFRGLGLLV